MPLRTQSLQHAWEVIRARHAMVPAGTVIAMPAGTPGSACGAVAWQAPDPTLLVGEEALASGAKYVLGLLLHHAGHALAANDDWLTRHARRELPADLPARVPVSQAAVLLGISRAHVYRELPVGRGAAEKRSYVETALLREYCRTRTGGDLRSCWGRYHTMTFRDAAIELGLSVGPRTFDGYSRTFVLPETASAYLAGIRDLQRSLDGTPPVTPPARASGYAGSGQVTAACECPKPRRMRIAPGVLAKGPVICGVCRAQFALPRDPGQIRPRVQGPGLAAGQDDVDGGG